MRYLFLTLILESEKIKTLKKDLGSFIRPAFCGGLVFVLFIHLYKIFKILKFLLDFLFAYYYYFNYNT